ncbi:MAG: VWA domain-containing protein [Bacteroidetes bacterium]|nr:VWA domain-containing protein [Bacteroidota bacterium]
MVQLNKRLGIVSLLVILAITGCSFNKTAPTQPTVVTDKTIPNTPQPSNSTTDLPLSVGLSWQCGSAVSFDVYLDTQNPPQRLINLNNVTKSYIVSNLSYGTTYYWQVFANYADGTKKAGPVWSFTTTQSVNPSVSGYVMYLDSLSTKLPNTVNAMFQVVDMTNRGVTYLDSTYFDVYEDGAPLSVSEAKLSIKKRTQVPYKIRTVLMLDNSTSLNAEINQIRIAASNFVKNILPNQEVAVYQFSEKIEMLHDFTDNKDTLLAALNRYQLGVSSTDFYGAAIKGASLWADTYTSDKIVQGSMIIISDGHDTQSSHTLAEALNAVANRYVFTLGLGAEIQHDILMAIGTAGYFLISDVSQLDAQFVNIQSAILNYANSFYQLSYNSPKRGNENHQLMVRIKNNPYSGEGSFIQGFYNSNGFYSP